MRIKIRQFVYVIVFAATSSYQIWSQDIAYINRIPDYSFSETIETITKFSDGKNLDSGSLAALKDLRTKATEIAKLNHECNSRPINKVPNPRCADYYLTTLPAFEAELSKITGNIYLNQMALDKQIKDQRHQIDACVSFAESFANPIYSPVKLATLRVKSYELFPVDSTRVGIKWVIDKTLDSSRNIEFRNKINAWRSACIDVVSKETAKYPFPERSWSQYFLSQFERHFGQSPFGISSDGDLVYRSKWKHVISINGEKLIEFQNPTQTAPYADLATGELTWDWTGSTSGESVLNGADLNVEISTILEKKFPDFGELSDLRDGIKYRTVNIEGTRWMAENLRFVPPKSGSIFGKKLESSCFNSDSLNCMKYGRLYSWEAAKLACPKGWKLPTIEELTALLNKGRDKMQSTTEWMDKSNGLDLYGLRILPAGIFRQGFGYGEIGNLAIFWSNWDGPGNLGYANGLGSSNILPGNNGIHLDKGSQISVRCLEAK